MTRSALALRVSLAIFALALVGCTEPVRRWSSNPCVGEGPCGEGGLCVGGYCAQPCASTADCDSGVCLKKHCSAPEYACSHGLCDDGNACSVDLCNAITGQCRAELYAGGCSDGDLCTVGDECVETGEGPQCRAAPRCDDGNPATLDSCNPATGECSHTP